MTEERPKNDSGRVEQCGMGTRCVRAAEARFFAFGGTVVPIVRSAAFAYDEVDRWIKVALGKEDGYIYSRNTNPTVRAFEEKMMSLEGSQDAVSFASGMAAVSNTLMALLKSGERAVSVKDLYGGSYLLFAEFLPRYGIRSTLCETTDFDQIEREIAKGCQLVYLESPTNPTLKVMDLPRLIKAAHKVGALVVVDNTFATPINQNPLEMGADLVLHSATKYLGGHGDVIGGVVCGSKELIHRVFHFREINGACLDAHAASLLIRGLKTLHLRVRQQNESAMAISEFLMSQSQVNRVFYPGLNTHPGHHIAERQMRGFGGVLSFELRSGFEAAKAFMEGLKYAYRAANLGAVETNVGTPATTSHVECTPEERAAAGIPEGLIRYAVGIEDTDDLIADISQALAGLAL